MEWLDNLYANIGEKCKSVARGTALLGMISVILAGVGTIFSALIYMLSSGDIDDYILPFLITVPAVAFGMVIGCVVVWAGTVALYALGQLVINTAPVKTAAPQNTSKPAMKMERKPTAPANTTPVRVRVRNAGKSELLGTDLVEAKCPRCGISLSFAADTTTAHCVDCGTPLILIPESEQPSM